jgi:hypothetical protein
MRSLALARYRFLTNVRRIRWVFPVFCLAIVIPLLGVIMPLVTEVSRRASSNAPQLLEAAAHVLVWIYAIHSFGLVILCASFGAIGRRTGTHSNLMETVPLTGQTLFWGDAAGIFMATMAVHLCTTPLLAEAVAIGPFPSAVFWIAEVMIALMVFFFSAAAAWSLSTFNEARPRPASVPLILLLFLFITMIIAATTRPAEFSESIATFFVQPSAPTWQSIAGTIEKPLLLIVLAAAIYGVFVAFYSIDTARLAEERG